MKRPNREGAIKRPRRRSSRESKKIVFGEFVSEGKNNYVAVGADKIIVSELAHSVATPIEQHAKVKALIKSSKEKHGDHAIILKVFAKEISLHEKIKQTLKDADLRIEFAQEIIDEADVYGEEVTNKDLKKRLDLSKHALCTIDGETAKDFDDAVFARKVGKNIEVTVAIADVSHYVKPDTALDEEAFLRGTSVYFPGRCVPMLPEQLSNGLCSLKPKVIRLAIAVSFELGPKGGIFRPQVKEAFIKSASRLTYNQVQDYYEEKNDVAKIIPPPVQESLKLLKKAAGILRKARERRGAIDFDIVEALVALDDKGEPTSINPQDRLDAHKIIEDLMVATNDVVAETLERKRIPGLFRVHEAPDPEKLEAFFKTAHAFGVMKGARKTRASSITEPKALQEVMSHYQNSKYKDVLNTLMLRAMMQARYSAENLMHFGLASTAYLHFTSPIRRYADLIVHRQIRNVIFERNYKKQIPEQRLALIAQSISEKEGKAVDVERKIDRLYQATFMSSRVGEEFDAVVVAATEFGMFVRVSEYHVEGLVHISAISRSRVEFIPEKMCLVVGGSNKTYMVGDNIRVKLINVNAEKGFIDFELVQEETREKTKDADKKEEKRPSRAKRKRSRNN